MPELPEVETVRKGLEQAILGKKIVRVEQRRADLRIPFPEKLAERLEGRSVSALNRRAKYILVELDDGNVLVVHLGMSGRVLILKDGKPYSPVKHDHLILDLTDGVSVAYNDARRFGMVMLIPGNDVDAHPAFKDMGPEPLGNGYCGEILAERLKGRKSPIKQALLDQKVVAGVGNIYACEALFESGIDPEREAGTIDADEAERLAAAVRSVLARAIAAGGSSLRDYKHTDGSLGYFQHGFAVYDREGMSCPGCDCDVSVTGGVLRKMQSGRSTFYCPRKQNNAKR